MSEQEREFGIVVWGATGFTGRLTAEYLLERYGTDSFRWALGGRNQAKLEQLRDSIGADTGVDASSLPLVVGDAADADSFVLAEVEGEPQLGADTVRFGDVDCVGISGLLQMKQGAHSADAVHDSHAGCGLVPAADAADNA